LNAFRPTGKRLQRDSYGLEYHPTDDDGKYVRAGDSEPRLCRGGMMFVTDNEIAWHEVGEHVRTPRGIGTVTRVDYPGCYYDVAVEGRQDRVTFKQAKSLN
jgi:hypothetical protein